MNASEFKHTMNRNEFKDVHEFDGQYKIKLQYKIPDIQKINLFKWLLLTMKYKLNSNNNGLLVITNNIGKLENYDNITGIFADDLLVNICVLLVHKKSEDRLYILKLLDEQMTDMFNLGQCSQGRVTRLFQIYNLLI
jgi:hypothetical protein